MNTHTHTQEKCIQLAAGGKNHRCRIIRMYLRSIKCDCQTISEANRQRGVRAYVTHTWPFPIHRRLSPQCGHVAALHLGQLYVCIYIYVTRVTSLREFVRKLRCTQSADKRFVYIAYCRTSFVFVFLLLYVSGKVVVNVKVTYVCMRHAFRYFGWRTKTPYARARHNRNSPSPNSVVLDKRGAPARCSLQSVWV